MGNCSSVNRAPFVDEIAKGLSNIEGEDIQKIQKVLTDAWFVYESLSSKERQKVKGLSQKYFSHGVPGASATGVERKIIKN